MSFFIAAISLGLLGSFHCIGMCGPIALALPVHQYPAVKKYAAILLYNVGRILTYTLLGLLFGILGQSFFLGGFQQVFSIAIGVLLLLSVFLIYTKWSGLSKWSFLFQFINSVKVQLAKLFNRKGLQFLFLIGVLNGLLPCGLVYLGIAGALSAGNFIKGAEFMFYFGLGTIPVMYAVAFFGQFISLKFRNVIKSSMPVVVSLMALLLIVRGLNLGIPYVSPKFENENHKVTCCEKKSEATLVLKCHKP